MALVNVFDEHQCRYGLRRLQVDQPKPTQANRVWVSDITYLPLASGNWVYCCAFQDVYTKQVVGWQVRADMPETLVTTALQRALLAQRPAPGLIVHSDRVAST
jgi:putative transposase